MNSKQIKKILVDKDLTPSKMAAKLSTETLSEDSCRQMIHKMISGRRFYPGLAKHIEKRFGITFTRQGTETRAA